MSYRRNNTRLDKAWYDIAGHTLLSRAIWISCHEFDMTSAWDDQDQGLDTVQYINIYDNSEL